MPSKAVARWPRYVLVIPVLLVVFLIFRLIDPISGNMLPDCPILLLTKRHCPGCGGTRAADALVHFEFTKALGYHAWFTLVVLIGLPVLFWMAAKEKYPGIFGPRFHVGWLWLCLVSLILFGVLRNTEVFHWLAPER